MRTQVEMKIERRAIAELLPYALNNRKHHDKQIKALAGFIREVGFRVPIAIDADGSIIAGHGRLLAAQKLGMTEVPVIVHSDLTEREKRAMRIADNRLAELAETDSEALAVELRDLEQAGFNLSLVGFDDSDLAALEKAAESVSIGADVHDVTDQLSDEFWVSIRGPMVSQTETLEVLRECLANVPGVEIEVGTTGRGE